MKMLDSIHGPDKDENEREWKAGDQVIRPDGGSDVVRACFFQVLLLEPYAPNEVHTACVLTERSWHFTRDLTRR